MPQGPNAKYVHKTLRPKSIFAKGSFRTIDIGGDKKMIVGCPKGHWDGRRCSVGMKGKTMLLPNYPNNPGRKMSKKRKSKWTVATAPRRVRLLWLKKAQRARRYYARCRARMGLGRKAPVVLRGPRKPYTPPVLTPSDTWEGPELARSVEQTFGPANWLRRSNSEARGSYVGPRTKQWMTQIGLQNRALSSQVSPGSRVTFVDEDGKLRTGRAVMRSSSGGWVLNMGGRYGTPAVVDDMNITRVSSPRARSRNPELLVVSNNPVSHGRSKSMRRRRRKSAGRKYPKGMWKKLVKMYGVKGAKRHAGGGGGRRRRRRRRNTWHGHRKAHARAARKGWRKRRRRGGKARRRKGTRARRSRRGRSKSRPFKGAIKWGGRFWSRKRLKSKIGKRRLAKLLKKRGRRNNPGRRRRFRRRN